MFPALARGLVGYELAMYTALRDAIYHFRFDYSRTQVIRVDDTRDSRLTCYFKDLRQRSI